MPRSAFRPALSTGRQRFAVAFVPAALLVLAACERPADAPAPAPSATAPAPASSPAAASPAASEPDRASALANFPPVPPELGSPRITRVDRTKTVNTGFVSLGLVSLVKAPASGEVVGHVPRGAEVTIDATERHVRPNPARVVKEHALADGRVVKAGDVVWVLDEDSPPSNWVWWNGATTSELIWPAWDSRETRDRDFWAVAADPVPAQDWSHVMTASGDSGWIDSTEFPFYRPDDPTLARPPAPVSPRKTSRPGEKRPDPPAALGAVFVDRDICPFECCTFGAVTARVSLALVDAPKSTRIVADIARGAVVVADSGEVHVVPRPMRVLEPTIFEHANAEGVGDGSVTAQKGEIVWFLERLGEGYMKVWRDGAFYDVDALEPWYEPVGFPLGDSAEDGYSHDWWVRVKTKSGVIGWVDNSDGLFNGFDSCA